MSEEGVGSVHEEAVRLLGVLGTWAREQEDGEHLDGEHLQGDCRFCPVCQLLHAVRQTRPEVREHLTTAATALLQAATELLATRPGTPGTSGAPASSGAAVERIDLDEDPERTPE